MNSAETRNFWISIMAGIFAAFLMYSSVTERNKKVDTKFGTLGTVLIAKEDIGEMQTIYENMVDIDSRPATYIDPDAIKTPEEVAGTVAAIPIKKGQQIVRSKLLNPGPDTGIALQVAPTKRAVTIPIDEMRSVSKLIRPGDRVDIIAAVDVGKGVSQRREAQILMQDVAVLATGVSIVNNIPRVIELDSSGKNLTQITLTGDSKYSTITVEASPKEAQDLIYILSTSPGNIFFTLRNPNDRAVPPRLPSSTAESVVGRATLSDVGAPPPVPQILPQEPPRLPASQPQQSPSRPDRSGFKRL
jgi:pilus assembly protein CpaB